MGAATTVIAIVAAAAIPLTSGEVDKVAPAAARIVSAEPAPVVPAGTPVRLMFTKEVNSRTARSGDRFKLRVDEPVYIDGKPVIPVGTVAWGEIETVKKMVLSAKPVGWEHGCCILTFQPVAYPCEGAMRIAVMVTAPVWSWPSSASVCWVSSRGATVHG